MYLTFHVFTIFSVLMMAVLRQSFISIIYVLILLPSIKEGSEVLKQSTVAQGAKSDDIKEKIEKLEENIAILLKQSKDQPDADIVTIQNEIDNYKAAIFNLRKA